MKILNEKHWEDIDPLRRYRIDEVQQILNCSKSMVYHLIYTGKLEWLKVGYHYRIPGWSLIDYIKENSSVI